MKHSFKSRSVKGKKYASLSHHHLFFTTCSLKKKEGGIPDVDDLIRWSSAHGRREPTVGARREGGRGRQVVLYDGAGGRGGGGYNV